MSDEHKQMIISADIADLKKLAKDGFDSVPDLVLSIDYQNNSFYDVKQSENFGTEKSGWIKDWKESLFNKIKSQGYGPPLHKGTKCDMRFKSSLNSARLNLLNPYK